MTLFIFNEYNKTAYLSGIGGFMMMISKQMLENPS
jgi:hypothetical protein